MENPSFPPISHDDFSLHFLIDHSINIKDDDHDHDTIMLDAKYAEELIFQEALMASLINPTLRNDDSSPQITTSPIQATQPSSKNILMEIGESSSSSSSSSSLLLNFFCEICAETKPNDQFFSLQNCHHSFCTDCITKHISIKLQKIPISEKLQKFTCPGLNCQGTLELERCLNKIPREILTTWGDAICESMISASHRFYCPYKDCSALLVNDGDEIITASECPFCNRLFCAQCEVPWHGGVDCEEFMKLSEGERGREDLMVRELAKVKKWQRCPQCKFFVEKMEGCLHLTCRCGYEFCYACGAKWRSSHHESCQ